MGIKFHTAICGEHNISSRHTLPQICSNCCCVYSEKCLLWTFFTLIYREFIVCLTCHSCSELNFELKSKCPLWHQTKISFSHRNHRDSEFIYLQLAFLIINVLWNQLEMIVKNRFCGLFSVKFYQYFKRFCNLLNKHGRLQFGCDNKILPVQRNDVSGFIKQKKKVRNCSHHHSTNNIYTPFLPGMHSFCLLLRWSNHTRILSFLFHHIHKTIYLISLKYIYTS